MVLDLIHIFYTWIIPILLQVINTIKIILEWRVAGGTAITWANTVIYIFLLTLTILFLSFLHSPAKTVHLKKRK